MGRDMASRLRANPGCQNRRDCRQLYQADAPDVEPPREYFRWLPLDHIRH